MLDTTFFHTPLFVGVSVPYISLSSLISGFRDPKVAHLSCDITRSLCALLGIQPTLHQDTGGTGLDGARVATPVPQGCPTQSDLARTDPSLLLGQGASCIRCIACPCSAGLHPGESAGTTSPLTLIQVFLQEGHFQLMVFVMFTHDDNTKDHLYHNYFLFASGRSQSYTTLCLFTWPGNNSSNKVPNSIQQ